MACSRRLGLVTVFLLGAAPLSSAQRAVPLFAESSGLSFHLPADLGVGIFAGRGSPVPATASFRLSPMLGLIDGRIRVGVSGAAFLRNPGIEALVGPRAAIEVHRSRAGGAGEIARLQVGGEALWGKADATLLGGFVRIELPEVLGFGAHFGRETRRHDWRFELVVGTAMVRAAHGSRAGRTIGALGSVYDSVRIKSRSKLLAASHTDPTLAPRLEGLLRRVDRNAPASLDALEKALEEADLGVLASGDLGLADTRRSAAAEFPQDTIEESAFLRAVFAAWRDTLSAAR